RVLEQPGRGTIKLRLAGGRQRDRRLGGIRGELARKAAVLRCPDNHLCPFRGQVVACRLGLCAIESPRPCLDAADLYQHRSRRVSQHLAVRVSGQSLTVKTCHDVGLSREPNSPWQKSEDYVRGQLSATPRRRRNGPGEPSIV